MRFAGISLAVNTAGSIGLFFLFRHWAISPHLGIAIATSIGGWLNAMLLYGALRRRGHFVADARLKRALPMICLASLALGTLLIFGADRLSPWLSSSALMTKSAALAALTLSGALLYFALTAVTGTLRLGGLARAMRRQK